jgi:hypothetical protein
MTGRPSVMRRGHELDERLSAVARSWQATVLPTSSPPIDAAIDGSRLAVVYTTTDGASEESLIMPSEDPNCPVGWRYTGAAQDEIELCGATCSKVRGDAEARLVLAFNCLLPGVFAPGPAPTPRPAA